MVEPAKKLALPVVFGVLFDRLAGSCATTSPTFTRPRFLMYVSSTTVVGLAVSKSDVRRMREPVTVTSSSVGVPPSAWLPGRKRRPTGHSDRAKAARPSVLLVREPGREARVAAAARSVAATTCRTEVIKFPSNSTFQNMTRIDRQISGRAPPRLRRQLVACTSQLPLQAIATKKNGRDVDDGAAFGLFATYLLFIWSFASDVHQEARRFATQLRTGWRAQKHSYLLLAAATAGSSAGSRAASSSTYAVRSCSASGGRALPNAGMSLRPLVSTVTTESRVSFRRQGRATVRAAFAGVTVAHHARRRVNLLALVLVGRTGRPAARLAVLPGAALTSGSAEPRGSDSIVPSKENSQTPSLRLLPASAVPPASTTTYCLPLYSKVEAGAFTPPSVWNSQSFLPLDLSSAVSRPSLRPMNTSPPPVTIDPL